MSHSIPHKIHVSYWVSKIHIKKEIYYYESCKKGIILCHFIKKQRFTHLSIKNGVCRQNKLHFVFQLKTNVQSKKRTISQAANKNAPTPKLAVELASTTCPGIAFSPIGCT